MNFYEQVGIQDYRNAHMVGFPSSSCCLPAVQLRKPRPPLSSDVLVARSSLALLVVGNFIFGFSANCASLVTYM